MAKKSLDAAQPRRDLRCLPTGGKNRRRSRLQFLDRATGETEIGRHGHQIEVKISPRRGRPRRSKGKRRHAQRAAIGQMRRCSAPKPLEIRRALSFAFQNSILAQTKLRRISDPLRIQRISFALNRRQPAAALDARPKGQKQPALARGAAVSLHMRLQLGWGAAATSLQARSVLRQLSDAHSTIGLSANIANDECEA